MTSQLSISRTRNQESAVHFSLVIPHPLHFFSFVCAVPSAWNALPPFHRTIRASTFLISQFMYYFHSDIFTKEIY